MRCKISCGCRKKNRKPLTSKQKDVIKLKSKDALLAKRQRDKAKVFKNKIIKARFNICEKCPHSVQTDRDKKYNIRICHKQNRPINTVAALLSNGCPIDRFKAST